MNRHWMFSLCVLFGLCSISGCEGDGDAPTGTQTPPQQTCNPACTHGETCDQGVCKCGDRVCNSDETCKDGTCEKTTHCEGENCDESSDPCDGKCTEAETCDQGVCKCGDRVCDSDETCKDGTCEKTTLCEGENCDEPSDPCAGACSEAETCDQGVCKCGDEVCSENQTCKNGKCEASQEDDTGDDTGDDTVCDPACNDNEVCNEGKCEPKIVAISCDPECDPILEYCDDNGVCQINEENACKTCTSEETCVSGICMCGDTICKEDEYCDKGNCNPVDPCAEVKCNHGEACVDGDCKAMPVSFNVNKLNILLSSMSNKLIATNSDDSDLKWTVGSQTEDLKEIGLRCLTSDGKISLKLSDCIIKDKNNQQESIQFIGYKRHLGTLKVTVENKSKAKAEATLTLKPYFDMDSFIYVNDKLIGDNNSKLIYRNGYAPGHKLPGYKEETNDQKIANLGGANNPYGKQIFTDEEVDLIDKDLYLNYVRPLMLKTKDQDGKDKYYATRASVVAAARFLILQFPYDIPYNNVSTKMDDPHNQWKEARSHYVFNSSTKENALSKVRIFGLNLTSNVFNSMINHKKTPVAEGGNVLRSDVIPWGAAYCTPTEPGAPNDPSCCYSKKNCESNKETTAYPFNGLECSGFVTWAFTNGQFGLGDWRTLMFAKSGSCKVNDKVVRNYMCEDSYVNSNKSNVNNSLQNVFLKLKRLEDSKAESDFIKLNDIKKETLLKQLKNVKAGDLLWRGEYIAKDADTYKNGHVAMIIGLKRDAKGEVTDIEVGEATGRNGNKLTKFTIEGFLKSTVWVKADNYASFIIKMGNVYNYYSDRNHITTASEKSDCPNDIKYGGDCYMYTDMYNEAFNDAIKNKT